MLEDVKTVVLPAGVVAVAAFVTWAMVPVQAAFEGQQATLPAESAEHTLFDLQQKPGAPRPEHAL